jgi:opacity protein-like surface antigen
MLKKAAVIGFTGLALGVSPAAAGSLSNGSTVALTMIGGGGAMAIGCMVTALLTQDDEDDQEGYDRRGIYLGLSGSYARQNFSDSSVVDLVGGELQENLRLLRGTPTKGNASTTPPADLGVYTFGLDDVDDDAFGYMGRAGYRCHPYFSTELQFEGLADFDGSITEDEAPPANDVARKFDLELESLVFTTNVKGHLLTGRTQPFVLVGMGFMRMESKARDTTPASNPRPTTPVSSAKCKPNLADPCLAAQASDITVEFAMRFGGGLDFYLTEGVVMSAEASYLMPTGSLDGLDYYVFSLGLQYRF